MPDKTQVMTWLEKCSSGKCDYSECPYDGCTGKYCKLRLMEDALTVIEEQEAEIIEWEIAYSDR